MWPTLRRFLTRDPLLAALVLALAALAVLAVVRARRREGWQFEGREKTISDKHKKRIETICRDGGNLAVAKANDKYKYLAKYSEADAAAICAKAWTAWKASFDDDGGDSADCKHGPCPSRSLRASRPCLNQAKTKCCNDRQKECTPIDTGSYRDKELEKKQAGNNAQRDSLLAEKGEFVEKVGECEYYTRVWKQRYNKWGSPLSFPNATGLNWNTSRDGKYDRHQCTKGATCVKKIKDIASAAGGSGAQPAAANAPPDEPAPDCGAGKTPCAEGKYMCTGVTNTCGCYRNDGEVYVGKAKCVDDGRAEKLRKCLAAATCAPKETSCSPYAKQVACKAQYG